MRSTQIIALVRDIVYTRRHGNRNQRRRGERALAALSHGDIDTCYRAWYGITPRVRLCKYGAACIHPGNRVIGGGDWRR